MAFEGAAVLPALPVIHQPLIGAQPRQRQAPFHVSEVIDEVIRQQRLTVQLFGFEVVIERALGHTGGLQDLVEADTGEALFGHHPVAGVEQVLAGVVVGRFHWARITRQ
ncbi:hypothetical protein D3C81_1921400 [compost metagenome]